MQKTGHIFRAFIISITLTVIYPRIYAQEKPALPDSSEEKWEFSATANLYFQPHDFFVMPIATADNGHLHLEMRYNYEDRNTISAWGGYNFTAGNKLKLEATPMGGIILGNTNGIAPGIEFTLSYWKLSLYHETEYLFSFDDKSQNYYYQWSELAFSPRDWAWFGIVTQRTRAYQTSRDLQRGFFAGGSYKNFDLNAYYFNPFESGSLFVLGLGYNF